MVACGANQGPDMGLLKSHLVQLRVTYISPIGASALFLELADCGIEHLRGSIVHIFMNLLKCLKSWNVH